MALEGAGSQAHGYLSAAITFDPMARLGWSFTIIPKIYLQTEGSYNKKY